MSSENHAGENFCIASLAINNYSQPEELFKSDDA